MGPIPILCGEDNAEVHVPVATALADKDASDDDVDMVAGALELIGAEPKLAWQKEETQADAQDQLCVAMTQKASIKPNADGKVFRGDVHLGTIRRYNEGRANDRWFVSCCAHGCTKIIPNRRALPEHVLIAWLDRSTTVSGPGDLKRKHTCHLLICSLSIRSLYNFGMRFLTSIVCSL